MERKEITIHTPFIKLQQALKLADFVNSGAECKLHLAEGTILVNGERVQERGKKLYDGDIVEMTGNGSFIIKEDISYA